MRFQTQEGEFTNWLRANSTGFGSGRAKHWIVYIAVLGLALAAARIVEQPKRGSSITKHALASDISPRYLAPEIRGIDLQHLAQRAQRETTADLFTARSWDGFESEEARWNAPPPASPPLPQAPALPFAFMGKLIDDGKTVVFLTNGDRHYTVRQGDLVEGNYRIEEIGEQTMTLSYLPLNFRQSLAIGSPALAGSNVTDPPSETEPTVQSILAASAAASSGPARLVWIAPPEVEIGEDFTVEVGLPSGPEPLSGRVELVYDARVLAILGGAVAAPAQAGTTTRRAIVDVIGPGLAGAAPTPSEVRFRVLAADPTSTRIEIENLFAVTAAGSALVVESPNAHRLAVVKSQGI